MDILDLGGLLLAAAALCWWTARTRHPSRAVWSSVLTFAFWFAVPCLTTLAALAVVALMFGLDGESVGRAAAWFALPALIAGWHYARDRITSAPPAPPPPDAPARLAPPGASGRS